MLTKWLEHKELYDGSQLQPLTNYLKHGLMGDSLTCWVGPCDVQPEHMIDGEDLREKALIQSDQMLHLVIELFHQSLQSAIFLQRLIGELVIKTLREQGEAEKALQLERRGDDLYWGEKKLNVSIATLSRNSVLLHFGINVTNEGTPVSTCALSDFAIEQPASFAQSLCEKIHQEVEGQKRAYCKIKTF